MKFEFYDSTGKLQNVTADISVSEMRAYLGEFKTHCVVDKTSYQFNHFINWLRKYYGISISRIGYEVTERIDM